MRILKNIKTILSLLVLLSFIGCNKETNWDENYHKDSKDPFGLYIFYNELKGLNDHKKTHYLDKNINDYLFYKYKKPDKDFGSYLCIKNNASKINNDGVASLLSFVFDGNVAFLSLNNFNYNLSEKLGFKVTNGEYIINPKELKGELYLNNSSFQNQPYNFDRNFRSSFFSDFNDNTTIVLGTNKINGEKKPNFIKIYHGEGAIYLHTNPIVFTNYYLLKDKENYVENILSYIPKSKTIWDPQIKRSKTYPKGSKKPSIFKFFYQYKTLTWFLYVSLSGLLLFLLFNAKRKQRAIPIIKPLENTTVAFTQTIASLYLKEKNHKNLADKKIKFFLEKVRKNYLISTSNLNTDFIEKLAAKSGNDLQKTKYLIHSIININKKTECTEEQLMVLHKMIDNFFKKQNDGNRK